MNFGYHKNKELICLEDIQMRRVKNVLYVIAILVIGANALAVHWVGVADPNTGVALWSVPSNWSTALVPVAAEKTQLYDNYPEAVIDYPGAVCGQLVLGDNGADVQNRLRIADGGSLLSGSQGGDTWTAAGYNRSGHITVERGGSMTTGARLGVGLVAATPTTCVSTLNVNGGLVDITGNLQIGSVNHKGIVTVKRGGLLESTAWEWRDTTGVWSLMDIEFGSVVIGGDVTAAIPGLITSGALTGFGGAGTINYGYDGVTTITANDPLNRSPVYTFVKSGSVNLTWSNMAPVPPATDVWVDVWFGTDPNKLNPATYSKVVNKGKNTTSVTVSAPAPSPTTYYWEVDWYRYGDPAIVQYKPADPNGPSVDVGEDTLFDAVADTPPSVVITTPRTATWIGQPIQMNTTVTDDGASPVTYLWTASKGGVSIDPNVIFSPSNTAANPTVTVDYHSGPFTVTVTVADGNPLGLTDSASVNHDCAIDACQATTAVINLDVQHPGDVELDCKVDLSDFALLARMWLEDYTLINPVPVP
jgi:hypothetical protein